MRRPKIFGARLAGIAALPLALVATAGIVSASSYSVFSGTTYSNGNSFSTGGVVLKNDSTGSQTVNGTALFSTGTLITPSTGAVSKCVTVQSTDTIPTTPVRLYVQNASSANTLAQYLDIKVEVGTATSTAGASCANFVSGSTLFPSGLLSTFESNYPTYAGGLATGWTPAATGTDTKVFKFTIQPDASMTNSQQSQTHTVDFVWEADQS